MPVHLIFPNLRATSLADNQAIPDFFLRDSLIVTVGHTLPALPTSQNHGTPRGLLPSLFSTTGAYCTV